MMSDPVSLHDPAAATPPAAHYPPCESCGAPLDEQQRYCLACGTRRKLARDPAARFLAGATRRQRRAAPAAVARSGSTVSILTLGAVLLVPLALGAGVLVGRSSSGSDARLIAALRAAKASAVDYAATGGGGAAGSVSGGPQPQVGSWTRSNGYTVELGTLPHGTAPASAAKVEQRDRAKGARSVGILASSGYHITPALSGAYVIYSGTYSTAAAADKALKSLKHGFPNAQVIHVQIIAAQPNTPVVNHTRYGSAHRVTGFTPSKSELAKGAQIAQQDSRSTGQQASGAGLPDVVVVP